MSILPSWRTLVTIAVSSALGGALALSVAGWLAGRSQPDPNQPPRDPHFVALGRAYLPRLGEAYGAAWEDGAKALDAGQPISAALDVVAKAWTANRTTLYDKAVTPELAKILPESVQDADVTPAERGAMAAAWRGLARGLGK
jgi:hypothetical protein